MKKDEERYEELELNVVKFQMEDTILMMSTTVDPDPEIPDGPDIEL